MTRFKTYHRFSITIAVITNGVAATARKTSITSSQPMPRGFVDFVPFNMRTP